MMKTKNISTSFLERSILCVIILLNQIYIAQIMIPLMRIKNGEKRWIKLKDKTLRKKAKGDDPQILVEMNIFWNP